MNFKNIIAPACIKRHRTTCKQALVVLTCMILLPLEGGAEMKSHKILFVGNSFTFYGKVGENVSCVINENHPQLRLVSDVCYKGGANLKSHFKKEDDNPLEKIKTGAYDLVVLQGGANLVEQDRKQIFREYLPIFIDAIRDSGALPLAGIFFQWLEKKVPNLGKSAGQREDR